MLMSILKVGLALVTLNVLGFIYVSVLEEWNDYKSILRARTKDLLDKDYIQTDNIFDKILNRFRR